MWRRTGGLVVLALLAACSSGGVEALPDPVTITTTTIATTTTAPTTTTTTAPTTTTTTAPTTTTTTLAPEPEAETDIGVLAAFVEERSGLVFEELPEITEATISRDEIGVDPGFFVDERLWNLFVPLRLVGPDDDRLAAGQARLDQVRGVCCPVLMFENDDHPLLRSMVVVHELTHLIDRQRSLVRGPNSDEPLRFDVAVLEGNAQRVAFDYRAELIARGAHPSRFDFDWADPRIPAAVLEVLEFPYEEGAVLSAALAERGGIELAVQAFDRLPVSSEQVLDVDAYLDDERPLEVAAPEPPRTAEITDAGTMGAFVLRLLAARTLDPEAAHDLAVSWAGDRYVLYERTGRSCLVATVVLDDAEAAATFVEVARGSGLGAVAAEPGTPERITLRGCAA